MSTSTGEHRAGASDEAALRRIIQKLEMKKLYQVLVVIDDFADTPQASRRPHANQHLGELPKAEAHQRSRAGEHAIPLLLCCWRLRNQHKLDAVIEELSALLVKEQYRLYEQATREPYSFLFVYYLKPRNEMFYKRLLPGPEAVRQLHADQREENISCCTSVAAVQPPVVRRTGGFLPGWWKDPS